MTSRRLAALAAAWCAAAAAAGARADERPVGHRETAWERKAFARHAQAARRFGEDYRAFIDRNRTVREVVAAAIAMAKKQGFRDLLARGERAGRLAPGAKVFAQVHGKLVAFAVVGKRPLREGAHVVAAHVNSVRLDLKQRPLYADGNLALLETHYYGGLKKYHWLSQPLELRGVVITREGKTYEVISKADLYEGYRAYRAFLSD